MTKVTYRLRPDYGGLKGDLVFDKLASRFAFIEKICGDGGYQGPKIEEASPRPMEIFKRNQVGFQMLPKRWIVERTHGLS